MEIALRTSERKWTVKKITHFWPKGSLLIGIPAARIQRKWVEICGDLMSPAKRGMFTKVRNYGILTAAWQQKWYDTFWAMSRGEMTRQAAWAVIAASGIDGDLGNDTMGDVLLTSTWMWSEWEKKHFFITRLDSEDHSLLNQIDYTKTEKAFFGGQWYIDYVTDIGLSSGSIDDIDDVSVTVEPRYNYTVDVSKLRDSTILATIGTR